MSSARTQPTLRPLLLAAIALLIILASRVPHMLNVEPEGDEINNIYLSMGSPAEVLPRVPYDWVAGGFLLMNGWIELVGLHPQALRWLPVLAFMLGCAFMYRLLRRWGGYSLALPGMLAYAALGLHLFLSFYMRGYAYAVALLPCALWLTDRYFHKPSLWRALVLALALLGMFYTQLTSAVAFLIIGLYSLFVYRGRVRCWWLPALLALPLALPEILRQRAILSSRLEGLVGRDLPPLPQAYADIFANFAGTAAPVWAALLLVGAALLVLRQRPLHPRTSLLLLWAFVTPVVMYSLNDFLGFFSGRYSWWIGTGIVLVVACGLATLPRSGRWLAAAGLAALCFAPFDATRYLVVRGDMMASFQWWTAHWRAGDVVLLDPTNTCGDMEKWDVYTRVFFPQGLQFVDAPADHRRVWYITFDGSETPALNSAVRQGRVAGRFFGAPGCLLRLYEAPPNVAGVPFANGLRFHGADVLDEAGALWEAPLVRREGDALTVRLWWSADAVPELDYSVGLYMLDGQGQMIAQSDSAPLLTHPEGAPQETSRWQPDTWYIEARTLTLPNPTARGTYRLALAVYGWWDGVRLSAPGVNTDGLLLLRDVIVTSW
jgi:hypothetical protein